MDFHFIKYINEERELRNIKQNKLKFEKNDLSPSLSKETIDYHYTGLAKKYFERYNNSEGDDDFNYGGAMLHNLYFDNLTSHRSANTPYGISEEIIEKKHKSFSNFKKAVEKEFMKAQGSNWIYIDSSAKIHTIHNHEYKKNMDIVLLIDGWEHAWALDYQENKAKYLESIWNIIDWDVVNSRMSTEEEK